MAESDSHRFLSAASIETLERLSRSRLYAYREADRRTFDFACSLVRDWERPIIGQTLWDHIEGVDKDVRTLLADNDAEVCIYVAKDTTRARNIFLEAIRDFRRSFDGSRPWRLRVVWVPPDFDVHADRDREAVGELITDHMARDVLLNVVLGNLSAEHVQLFVRSTGAFGLDFALLYQLGFHPFVNMTALAREVRMSTGTIRERLTRLLGCGFIAQPDPTGSFYAMTTRGRVFFEVCRELVAAKGRPGPELGRILDLLGLSYSSVPDDATIEQRAQSRAPLDALTARVLAATDEFGVDLLRTDYFEYWTGERWPPTVQRPSGPIY